MRVIILKHNSNSVPRNKNREEEFVEQPTRQEVNARVDKLIERVDKRTGHYWEKHGQPPEAEPYEPDDEDERHESERP